MRPSAVSLATDGARPRRFDAVVQAIASAAFLRGTVVTRAEAVVGAYAAADLCRLLRAAHAATAGDERARAHVERLASGITLRLGTGGPVAVSRMALGLLEGYAKRREKRAAAPQTSSLAKPGRCRVKRDGGGIGNGTEAHAPSVTEDGDTSPSAMGRRA